MAYTVTELPTATASISTDGRQYTRNFRVVSDDRVHPALAAAQIPVKIGYAFSTDPLSVCRSIDSQVESESDHQSVYVVSAQYETRTNGGEKEETDEDPLNDRPSKRWYSRQRRLPIRFHNGYKAIDAKGNVVVDAPLQPGERKPITNSAGEPFDPLPEDDFQVLVFEYQVNQATYDERRTSRYRGAINSDNFTLAGLDLKPYQARLADLQAVTSERGGVRYWAVSVTIEIADDWRLLIVDEGFQQLAPPIEDPEHPQYILNGNFTSVVPIINSYGEPVQNAVMLDGKGAVLANGQEPILLAFTTVAKPELPFSTLGLPLDNLP